MKSIIFSVLGMGLSGCVGFVPGVGLLGAGRIETRKNTRAPSRKSRGKQHVSGIVRVSAETGADTRTIQRPY